MKKLIIVLLLLMTSGCGMKHVKKDPAQMEAQLKNRIERYRMYFMKHEFYMMWEMRSEKYRAGMSRSDFLGYLDGQSYVTRYYRSEYVVDWIELKDSQAKVKIRHLEQEKKDSQKNEYFLYEYWIYENDNWFFDEGTSEMSYKVGW